MIPLVGDDKELKFVKKIVVETADAGDRSGWRLTSSTR